MKTNFRETSPIHRSVTLENAASRPAAWRPLSALAAAVILAAFGRGASDADRWSLRGETQVLAMQRDYGDGVEGSSISVSLTVNAAARVGEAIAFGAQFTQAENLDETGRDDAAYWLSNDKASVLTQLYVKLAPVSGRWEGSRLALGRLPARYAFFPAYKARHKEQSFEGATFETPGPWGSKLELGHIQRYSAWPSREGGTARLTADFRGFARQHGFDGGESGTHFTACEWAGERIDFAMHDYVAEGFYNDVGFRAAYALNGSDGPAAWTLALRADKQDGFSSGRMPNQEALVAELALRRRTRALTIDVGLTTVAGESDFATPFRTAYAIDATLLWYTSQFERDTRSLHCAATLVSGSWSYASVATAAWHGTDDRREQELDVVVKRSFQKSNVAGLQGRGGATRFSWGRRDGLRPRPAPFRWLRVLTARAWIVDHSASSRFSSLR